METLYNIFINLRRGLFWFVLPRNHSWIRDPDPKPFDVHSMPSFADPNFDKRERR